MAVPFCRLNQNTLTTTLVLRNTSDLILLATVQLIPKYLQRVGDMITCCNRCSTFRHY